MPGRGGAARLRRKVNETSLDAEHLVFVDETGISTKMVRTVRSTVMHEGAEMLACRVPWNWHRFPHPFLIPPISPQRFPREIAYCFDTQIECRISTRATAPKPVQAAGDLERATTLHPVEAPAPSRDWSGILL